MTMSYLSGQKLFVLDTNVLMHDPTALFHFQEHPIFLPMVVLEELDQAKKGLSELARNVRQVSHFLDELMQGADRDDIDAGIELKRAQYAQKVDPDCNSRLFFQTRRMVSVLPESLPGEKPDNSILGTILALKNEHPDTYITLVSKDINLRIKAAVLGIHAEDYSSDQVLDDVDLLYSGSTALPNDFWEQHADKMTSWQEHSSTFYKLSGPQVKDWQLNEYLYTDDDSGFEAVVRACDGETATIELVRNYRDSKHSVWGIQARNREQNFALNALLDPQIDFVTLLGKAGTGKTLLTLAAALHMSFESKLYQEIIMTRETVPVGEDIGFLPGTEEEKMAPWMGALMDNLEVLGSPESGGNWEKGATQSMLLSRVKIRSLSFMRGRTFVKRFIILDEAQNLTAKQMKTLISRAGPGTKIVCLGNIAQIDTPYLTGTTSGLTYVVDRFKSWPYSAHLLLKRGERSRLADHATKIL